MKKRLLVFIALGSIASGLDALAAKVESVEESAARMFREAQPYWLTRAEFEQDVREKSPYIEVQMHLEQLGASKEEIREHIDRFLENKNFSTMAQLLSEIYDQPLPARLQESPLGKEVSDLKQALQIDYSSENLDTSNFIRNPTVVEALIYLKPEFKEILLAEAIKYNADKTFHMLLSHIDVNNVALVLAARNNRLNVVQALLKVPDINVNIQDQNGATALLWAVDRDNLDIVQALLGARDINVNIQDQDGFTALLVAVYRNNLDMVQDLLGARGIDVNLQNKNGETALSKARNEQIKTLLHQHGAT